MRTFILCILILSGCKTNTADTRQAVSLIEDSIVHLNGALSINGTNMVKEVSINTNEYPKTAQDKNSSMINYERFKL